MKTAVFKGKRFPLYLVSEDGFIYRRGSDKPLIGFDDNNGYDCVDLMDNGIKCRAKVHLIVAHTYLGPQKKDKVVDHLDGDKKNNKASNLEYISQQNNVARAQVLIRNLEYLTTDKREKIKTLYKQGKSIVDIANLVGSKYHVVRDFLYGKTYR